MPEGFHLSIVVKEPRPGHTSAFCEAGFWLYSEESNESYYCSVKGSPPQYFEIPNYQSYKVEIVKRIIYLDFTDNKDLLSTIRESAEIKKPNGGLSHLWVRDVLWYLTAADFFSDDDYTKACLMLLDSVKA